MIEQAEQVYASFVDKTPDDARLRFDQANSIYEVAKILDALGAVREALQKADEAIAIAGAVDTTSIVDGEHETMGNWLVFKGHLQTKLGDFAEANESFAEGLAHYKKLEAALPNETGGDSIQPYMASARADALAQQAMGEIQAKNVSAAIEFSEQCEEIWRRLAEHQSIGSQSDNIRFLMAHSFLILGQVYDVANDLPKSEQLLSEAIEIAESIDAFAVSAQVGARRHPGSVLPPVWSRLVRQERYDEMRAAYDISLARFQQLVHDFPDVARYREFQSSARYSLAFTEYLCKNYELARDLVHANIASHQQLIVSFRQVCMTDFAAAGIVGCHHTTRWRTADAYQQDASTSAPAGSFAATVQAMATDSEDRLADSRVPVGRGGEAGGSSRNSSHREGAGDRLLLSEEAARGEVGFVLQDGGSGERGHSLSSWPQTARTGIPECILELEDVEGAKMRIQLKGIEPADLVALSRSLWGVE